MKNISIKIATLLVLLLVSSSSFAQKKKANAIQVEILSYQEQEQDMGSFVGKAKFIMGVASFKKGKKELAVYRFIAPLLGENVSHITVLDDKEQKIFPRIHYLPKENCFTYFEGTNKEGKKCSKITLDNIGIVLFGLEVWGEVTYGKK